MGSGGYSRAKFLILGAGIALAALGIPRQALADCVNPSAPEGRLVYNATAKIAQVCDGTNWISLGGSGGGGGASALVGLSDVDAASAGEGDVLIFNTVSGKWESGPPPGGSAGSDTEVIFNDGGALSGNASFVFDKDNIRLGIGTATPGESVDVTGIVTADGLTLKSVAADPPLSSSLELGDLADVDTSGAADGLVLKYNSGTNSWGVGNATNSGGSVHQISEHVKEFSGVITGPGNWPACTDPPKVVTLGQIGTSPFQTFIDVSVYGSHRGYNNDSYFSFRRWVMMVGDRISANLIDTGGTSAASPTLWDGSSTNNYNGIDVTSGFDVRLRVPASCGAVVFYTYVVRYYSGAAFAPHSTRSW